MAGDLSRPGVELHNSQHLSPSLIAWALQEGAVDVSRASIRLYDVGNCFHAVYNYGRESGPQCWGNGVWDAQ
ncbi:MAG TPA: hypothetical protein V6C97_05690 [Oculatellaceae cyanobacterium]